MVLIQAQPQSFIFMLRRTFWLTEKNWGSYLQEATGGLLRQQNKNFACV